MSNAAIYARFSSHSQREESIDDQVRVCTAEAMRNGDTIVALYADSAISGTTDARPQFQRMVKDGEAGKWEVLYIYKQDRFARDRYDAATYKRRLKRAGVRIVSAAEKIPEGADGILLESLLEGMAEYYSANLSQNIRRGIEGNALACKANGRPIYGYRTGADGRYEVDEEEAEAVRFVFERYAAGDTYSEILKSLKGCRTRRGRPLNAAFLSKMVRRESYVGVYEYAGHRVEGGMPAIVERQTWEAVQAKLGSNRKHSRSPVAYLLSGKLYDDQGRPYIGTSGRSRSRSGKPGQLYRYYHVEGVADSYIAKDEIESIACEGVLGRLNEDGAVDYIVGLIMAAWDGMLAADDAERERVAQALAANDRESERLVDAICKIGADDRITARLEALRAEAEDLREARKRLECQTVRVTPDAVKMWLEDMIAWSDTYELIASFISRVTVTFDGRVFVEFNMIDNAKIKGELPSSAEISQLDGSSPVFRLVEARRIELRSTAIP